MTLRTARIADTQAVVDLIAATHERSRYAELPFDRQAARSLVMQAVQRNLGKNDGGCLVVVDEVNDQIEAVIIATLSKVYMVVDALKATDLFLVASPEASPFAARRLLGAYIAWAESNPKVYEIELTHTDVTEESARMGEVYQAMGFAAFGHAYRRSNPGFGAVTATREKEPA